MTETPDQKLRRLHRAIHNQIVYGGSGYSPSEADELLADYAATVLARRDAHHPRPHLDHADRCCREHGTHSTPHRGCILR